MNKLGDVKEVRRGLWGLASWYGPSVPTKKAVQLHPNGDE